MVTRSNNVKKMTRRLSNEELRALPKKRNPNRPRTDPNPKVSSAIIPSDKAESFFNEVDFSDLDLMETERNFLCVLPLVGWSISEAGRKCFADKPEPAHHAQRVAKRPRVIEGIRRIREKLWLKGDWTLERSRDYSLRMVEYCQQRIRNADDPAKYKDFTDHARALGIWMKRLEFWKESLDRLTGLLFNDRLRDTGEKTVRWRELSELSDAQLLRLNAAVEAHNATDQVV